jgi:muconolactone delta-isomerase
MYKRKTIRMKKAVVFVMVFAAVYGFTAVDEAYSDTMDQTGKVALNVRRVNSDYITLSIFGQTAAINIKELHDGWDDISNTVTASLDHAVSGVQDFLRIDNPKRDYSVFKTEIL